MQKTEEYNVNFFTPLTAHAKKNKRLIVTLIIIWFFAVFGFQVLLMILNKPTPEKAYTSFTSIWSKVENNELLSTDDNKVLSKTFLSVLGKNIAVKENHKNILKESLSWSVLHCLPDSNKRIMFSEITPETITYAEKVIGLQNTGFDKIMINLLPHSLVKVVSDELGTETKLLIPDIMKLYLVHNQSSLTDFNFIGFPFHYWYTSQFLLILFVILCLTYALIIDRTNKKYNFIEEV